MRSTEVFRWSFLTKQKRKRENGVAASGELDFLLPELPIEKAAITRVKEPLFIPSFTVQKAGSVCSSSRSSRLLCHLGAWLVLFHTYPVATVVRFSLQRLRGLKAAQVRSRRRNWKMTCSLPWLLFPTEEQLQSQEYVEEATSIPWETPRLLGFKFWIILFTLIEVIVLTEM